MNKIIKVLVASLLIAMSSTVFAAAKKSIVCTTFPQYDWVMNILGQKNDTFEVTLLLNKGTDLHSYQPSVRDIAKISVSDLFVYVGGESDEWVEKVIDDAKNKNIIAVSLMQVLGDRVYEEELVEGMQGEEEEEGEDEEEEPEYDEHVWLSLNNAIIITEYLSEQIQKLDAKNAAAYKSNTETYVKQLYALDAEYSKTIVFASRNVLLFADRFPFRYLTEDYNLKYYAAFVGCSAESEASFETITFLAKKLDELELPAVITLEKSDKKIAKTIIASSSAKNQKILQMDSIQSITQKEIKAGKTYLSAMKNNLEVLKEALR